MGQEEVSEMREAFNDECNSVVGEKFIKDIEMSGKGITMKTRGKKRIFALLMCVIMLVSTMSVWAAYTSRTIGSMPNEKALCELYMNTNSGEAYTTPVSSAVSVTTAVAVTDIDGNVRRDDWSTSAYAYLKNVIAAASTHQAGLYYTSLDL